MRWSEQLFVAVVVAAVVAQPTPTFSDVPAPISGAPTLSAYGPSGLLCIKIQGLPSDRGMVRVAIYHSRESYVARRGSFRKAVLPIAERSCEWVLDGLPYGEYAVMFYQDANGNARLDRSRLGLPLEPFGFSNNARPRLGPPPYERVKFDVTSDLTTLLITTQGT